MHIERERWRLKIYAPTFCFKPHDTFDIGITRGTLHIRRHLAIDVSEQANSEILV